MVRNLQILPQIPQVPDGSGMTHIATSYEVSRSPYFDTTEHTVRDEEAIIVSNLEDTVNLASYYIDIPNVTEDTDIYVRYKLHYQIVKDGSTRKADLGWSSIVNMKGDQEDFKVSDVILATPRVFVKKEVAGGIKTLKITTSPMEVFIGYGDHKATTWEITTSDNKQVLYRNKSKELLTEIELPISMFPYNEVFIIKAIHHSSTNAESLPGKYIYNEALNNGELYQFNIETDLITNRKLLTSCILSVPKFKTIDVVLKDAKGRIVAQTLNHPGLYPTVDVGELVVGDIYGVFTRIQYETDKYTEWKFVKNLIAKDNTAVDINKLVDYETKYVYTQPMIQPGIKFLYGKELSVGGFIMPASENSGFNGLSYYRIEGGLLTYIKDIEGSENSEATKQVSCWNTAILPLYNGDIIVNRTKMVDSDGLKRTSVWSKYSINVVSMSFELVKEVELENHTGACGISGSCIATLDNDIIFIPPGIVKAKKAQNLKVFKLKTKTMEVEELADLPFEATQYVSMCLVNDNKALVLGGCGALSAADPKDWTRGNNDIFMLDIKKKTFANAGSLNSLELPNWYNVHAVLRKDGKVAIFNQSEGAGIAVDQQVALYDPEKKTVEKLDNDFEDGRVYLKTLLCNNGNIIRISSSPVEPQLVYTYKTKGTIVGQNITPSTIADTITDLVVKPNETVVIDNPYKYTSITIQGNVDDGTSGTLVWLGKNNLRKFQADTKFITKSLLFYNDDIDTLTQDGKWKQIFMLDDTSITVRDDNKPAE